ncbi:Hypothetical protein PHPALM_6725 [Phytophthora palmivora]|uniref:DDE Tnp4 domain-containing protein n=1 Tax=Phytophthora palmivora TaxID=4796 RepID=A0A2P4YEF6_9STRA|nr:Hypothetical protein PHPALM_6725 [Phytophthora palmivora]
MVGCARLERRGWQRQMVLGRSAITVDIIGVCCDYRCRFIYINVSQPGSCNDSTAFQQSGLHGALDEMENGFYLLGDNAYVCTAHMLTPFTRTKTTDGHRDAYNVYLSQLRIRLEMSFNM